MEQETEKRMADSYEITQGIQIGDKEVVFGIDEESEMPYLCGFYVKNEIFESYSNCMIGNDYAEMVEMFADRVKEQCIRVKEERTKVTVPRGKITQDMCLPLDGTMNLTGKVAVIRTDVLRPEYRSAECQLVLVTGGNGALGSARGRACFCTNLYNGDQCRWERYDIQGEIRPECMPQWAKERLEEIQKAKEKKKDAVQVEEEKERETRREGANRERCREDMVR